MANDLAGFCALWPHVKLNTGGIRSNFQVCVYVDLDKASIVRFNEFGTDGGPAAKELIPKMYTLRRNVSARFGFDLPVIDVSFSSSVD